MLWGPSRSGEALRDEFLRLHYARSAPPIRRLIEQIEAGAYAVGQHPTCFGSPKQFGYDDTGAQQASAAFDEATRLAGDDDALRSRVEKASVVAYRLAIEPCFRLKETDKIDPPLAEKMKPLVKRYFELCAKYQITSHREGGPIDEAKNRLTKLLWQGQPAGF
jgi:hypothetical protein